MKNQSIKFCATKRPRRVIKSARNAGLKNSKATQNKRNHQSQLKELDIARRNAAMNSSRETLLWEKEEEKKRLRFPIGKESDLEQPSQSQT